MGNAANGAAQPATPGARARGGCSPSLPLFLFLSFSLSAPASPLTLRRFLTLRRNEAQLAAVLSPCSRRASSPSCDSEDLRWSRRGESSSASSTRNPAHERPGQVALPRDRPRRSRSLPTWRARTCRRSGPRPTCSPSTCSVVVVRSVYVSLYSCILFLLEFRTRLC